jgi:hypothetical protein
MSRIAHADALVPRSSLTDPEERGRLRIALYRALMKLGNVESIDRYIADPPDGPLHDPTAGDIDFDQSAIVRVVGHLTPFT